MTKKDYILIANSIYRSKQVTEWTEKNKLKKYAKLQAISLIAHDLSGSLYGQNNRFDRDKFLTACGIDNE